MLLSDPALLHLAALAGLQLHISALQWDASGKAARPVACLEGVHTLNGCLMPSWHRYFISSNSPSGGTKLTTFSVLNLPRLTHWWKVTSCMTTTQWYSRLRGLTQRQACWVRNLSRFQTTARADLEASAGLPLTSGTSGCPAAPCTCRAK